MSYSIEQSAAYLSHLPLLSAAVSVTTGPVLELGAGLGSTYLLHGMCGVSRRKLLTIESDENWMQRFMKFGRPWHQFKKVDDYQDLQEYKEPWGLAFVDHGLYKQRGHSILQLKHVPIVVVHDTCYPWLYDYVNTLSHYKYRWDWQLNGPQTTVVSDIKDIRKIFGGMGL